MGRLLYSSPPWGRYWCAGPRARRWSPERDLQTFARENLRPPVGLRGELRCFDRLVSPGIGTVGSGQGRTRRGRGAAVEAASLNSMTTRLGKKEERTKKIRSSGEAQTACCYYNVDELFIYLPPLSEARGAVVAELSETRVHDAQ